MTVGVLLLASYGAYLLVRRGIPSASYEDAVSAYNRGDFERAIRSLREALNAGPPSAGIFALLGWSYYKSGQYEPAERSFRQAFILDPLQEETKLGLAYASLANDHPTVALPLLKALVARKPGDAELQLALAEAHFKRGDNVTATKAYRDLVEHGVAAATAKERFLALYGYPEYSRDLPLEPTPVVRPSSLVLDFRARGNYLEAREGTGWVRVYPRGVNIGPARPGEFPSTPPLDPKTYLDWLKLIADMNANMVRAYTVLPPAFYQALKIHNERSPKKLWLLQEVWLTEHPDKSDLYDGSWTEEFKQEIRDVIDVIHGQANIPYRRGHAAGIYTADVSPYVFAIGLGRELEPHVAVSTNEANPHRERVQYQGRFVSITDGNPTEVWFAEMADRAVQYESERYNSQRPITVVNWPPLDPMHHVTESNYADELRIRRERGEDVDDVLTYPVNDADAVSLDIRKFFSSADFRAGLFAAFHVYPYWPDFLLYDPVYPQTRDREGTNRYLGYLLDLKKNHPNMPLFIAEYGVPTSWGIAHVHPDGWGNGGFSEKGQAEVLARMTRNIRDAGAAGGLVFAWQDEWWKRVSDDFTRPFVQPGERARLWLNQLDPEEFFGILGYRSPAPIPLLRGEPKDWEKATKLISARSWGKSRPGALKTVYALSDAAFLYLRLDVAKGDGREKTFDWQRSQYWIALNGLPGAAGSRMVPELDFAIDTGATFLIRLTGPESSRISISQNYNPQMWRSKSGVPGGWRLVRRAGMQVALEDFSPFEELIIEANPPRYGRDGSVFPPVFVSRSALPYGTADPSSGEYSSNLSAWHADEAGGMIEVRIPWGLLYFMDPSSRLVMAGMDDRAEPLSRESPGVSVVAMAVRVSSEGGESRRTLLDSLPAVAAGRVSAAAVPVYTWRKWDRVQYVPYLKASYFALQKAFGQLAAPSR